MTYNKFSNCMALVARWIVILFPFILFCGNAIVDIAISTIAVFFLLNCYIKKDYKWTNNAWFVAALTFWGYAVLRSFFTEKPTVALASTLPFCRFFIFAAAIAFWLFKDSKTQKPLFLSLILCIAVVSLDAIFQYIFGFDFFGNTPVNNSTYVRLVNFAGKQSIGITLASISFLSVAHFIDLFNDTKSTYKHKAISIIFILIAFLAVMLSGERTAFLMMILGYAILLWKVKIYKKLLMLKIVAVAALGLIAIITTNSMVLERQVKKSIQEIENFESSSYGRIFHTGIELFKQNPIFGIGSKHFQSECDKMANPDSYYYCSTHPHNIYIQMLTEFGIVGFVLFIFILFNIAKLCWYNKAALCKDSIAFAAFLSFWFKYIPIISTSSYFIAWSVAPSWFMLGILITRFQQNAKA